jgi:translocation and assembly module TamA
MNAWRTTLAAGCATALLGLGGCASVSALFGKPEAEPAGVVVTPTEPVYRLEIEAPGKLRGLLATYLDLSRYQNAPAGDEITRAEIDRLMSAAPAQVRSLLETEGYFAPEVQVSRVGSATLNGTEPAPASPAAAQASAPAPAPTHPHRHQVPRLRLQVQPGPRAVVDRFEFQATGPLQEAAETGDLAARVLIAQVRNEWQLPPEWAFRQSDWSSAKNTALAKLRADGYPAATWGATSARVDEASHSVALELSADSGALYRLGSLDIEGLKRYDASTVNNLWTLQSGTPYREADLLDFQDRLQKAGLFEGASVVLDAAPDTAQAAPVEVRVRELTLQQATFGVGVSANTGPRLTAEHIHRQPFGWQWIAKNTLELGSKLKSWSGELTSYPLEGLHRNLIAAHVERLEAVKEVRDSASLRMGRSQDTPRIERLTFAEITHSKLDTASDRGTITSNSDALSGSYHWIYRDLDSVLLPTDGQTLSTQTAVGYALSRKDTSGTDHNGPFARLYGRYTLYRPLGAAWYGTARVEAGQVITRRSVGIPDTLLFRAGGDDSVRGYAYRSLGPESDGALLSGRVLLTGSAEVARPISAQHPSVWWAAFVDAGNAADSWQHLRPVLGYGLGLRWRSPVGPLRVDMAYGDDVQAWRMHLSVGIAF